MNKLDEIIEKAVLEFPFNLDEAPRTFAEEVAIKFGKHLLKEAAENAELEHRVYAVDGSYKVEKLSLGKEILLDDVTDYPINYCGINKQSITDTINKYL